MDRDKLIEYFAMDATEPLDPVLLLYFELGCNFYDVYLNATMTDGFFAIDVFKSNEDRVVKLMHDLGRKFVLQYKQERSRERVILNVFPVTPEPGEVAALYQKLVEP